MNNVTDYCKLWPEGTWAHCCKAHDLAYELATGRIEADIELAKCVAQSNPLMGVVMGAGVIAFGWFFYKRKKSNGLNRRDKNTG